MPEIQAKWNRSIASNAAIFLLVALPLACQRAEHRHGFDTRSALARSPQLQRTLADTPPGLSGLSRDRTGDLCAVAERGTIVLFDRRSGASRSIPLRGADPAIELESIEILEDGRIVLGTEIDARRTNDAILVAQLSEDGSAFNVKKTITFDYTLWGIEASPDQGLEGICTIGNSIVVVAESVKEREGERLAPIGVYNRQNHSWTIASIQLTSRRGKLAGLSCREIRGNTEFVAIERHFGITRILRGKLADPLPEVIIPKIVYDWPDFVQNLEGIVWSSEDRIELVNDNFFRGRTDGPSSLFSVPLPDDDRE